MFKALNGLSSEWGVGKEERGKRSFRVPCLCEEEGTTDEAIQKESWVFLGLLRRFASQNSSQRRER